MSTPFGRHPARPGSPGAVPAKPRQFEDLLDTLRLLVANDPDDLAIVDQLMQLLPMSWPDWLRHLDGEQALLRLVQQVRAGTI